MSVGLNTNYSMYGMPFSGNGVNNNSNSSNNNNSNSLLNFSPSANAYEDDLMMSNMNFAAIAGSACTPVPQASSDKTQTQGSEPSFSGGTSDKAAIDSQSNTASAMGSQELNGYLASKVGDGYSQTEKGGVYKKSDAAKVAGFTLGALAPATGKFIDWFRGGSFKALFKSKQLAIACPVVALAGLAVGALVDNNINTKRAQATDEELFARIKQQQSTPNQSQAMNKIA